MNLPKIGYVLHHFFWLENPLGTKKYYVLVDIGTFWTYQKLIEGNQIFI